MDNNDVGILVLDKWLMTSGTAKRGTGQNAKQTGLDNEKHKT